MDAASDLLADHGDRARPDALGIALQEFVEQLHYCRMPKPEELGFRGETAAQIGSQRDGDPRAAMEELTVSRTSTVSPISLFGTE